MIAISDATLLSSSVSFQSFGSWLVFSMITCDEIRNYSEHNISYYNIVLRATDHLSLGWTGEINSNKYALIIVQIILVNILCK